MGTINRTEKICYFLFLFFSQLFFGIIFLLASPSKRAIFFFFYAQKSLLSATVGFYSRELAAY